MGVYPSVTLFCSYFFVLTDGKGWMLRMREVKTGIYKITNLDNGKMYVGQAIDIYDRWDSHIRKLKSGNHDNSYLQNSWNLHGKEKFKFDILELCDYTELDEREIYWIDKLKTYKYRNDSNGYNLTLGGQGYRVVHEVLQFDLNGNFLNEWQNGVVAAAALGISYTKIYGVLSKRHKYTDNYIFIYKEEYKDSNSLAWYLDRKYNNRVLQYDRNGTLINSWNNVKQAEAELGYNIGPCVSHITYTCHDYIFIYEKEKDIINKEYCEWAYTRINNTCNNPFYKLDSDGNILKRYSSLREAENDGYTEKMVNDCIRGLRNKYKGFIWAYENNIDLYTKEYCNELFNKQEPNYRGVPILQYKDNVLINRYEKLADVPSEFVKTNIAECCKGRKPQYKGFTWRYDLDELKGDE